MRLKEKFNFYTLPCGIRIVHRQVKAAVAHAGIIIEAGCRNEDTQEQGIAHFIEHCLFKGTNKRSALQVFGYLEDVGGELNAYTGREETFIYASFLPEYYSRALELFEDILFHSSFSKKELEKEKLVVLEEINSFKDNPYELIYDEFDERVFHKHPLGRNILGTEKTITSFQPVHLKDFVSRHYRPEKMVLCSVGDISGTDFFNMASKLFSLDSVEDSKGEFLGKVAVLPYMTDSYEPFIKTIKKRTFQNHCLYGNLAFSYQDPRRLAFALLVNLLGGPAMSSRLNLSIREHHGYAYQVESTYTPFKETGIFSVYLGTDNTHLDKSIELLKKELDHLCRRKLNAMQLLNAKKQYLGQMAINLEINMNQMLSIGKSYLVYNKVDTFEEMAGKIENLNASELLEVANEVFSPESMSCLIYKSKD